MGYSSSRRGRPASRLGGDVVTAIDGRPITGQMDLNLALNRKRPGDTVKVEYYRGGQKTEAQVTLSDASR